MVEIGVAEEADSVAAIEGVAVVGVEEGPFAAVDSKSRAIKGVAETLTIFQLN